MSNAAETRPVERLTGLQLPLGIVLFIISEVLAGVITALVAFAMWGTPPSPGAASTAGGVPDLVGMLAGAALSLAGLWLIVRVVGRRKQVTELAAGRAIPELAAGLLIGVVLMSAVIGILALLGMYRVEGLGTVGGVVAGLAVGIGPGVMEEVLFRGFALRLVDRWTGTVPALAITAIFFGLAHLGNPDATVFGAVAIMVEAGILLGAAYLLTGRLWLAIGIHAAWNFTLGGIYGAEVSGSGRSAGLLRSTISGPSLLTGGEFGVEGSLITILVCGSAGAVLLILARRAGRIRGIYRRPAAEPSGGPSGGPTTEPGTEPSAGPTSEPGSGPTAGPPTGTSAGTAG